MYLITRVYIIYTVWYRMLQKSCCFSLRYMQQLLSDYQNEVYLYVSVVCMSLCVCVCLCVCSRNCWRSFMNLSLHWSRIRRYMYSLSRYNTTSFYSKTFVKNACARVYIGMIYIYIYIYTHTHTHTHTQYKQDTEQILFKCMNSSFISL